MSDREKLRKLAAMANLSGPGVWDDAKVLARIYQLNAWGTDLVTATEFIAAANPADLLDLLDQLDAAEAKLAAVRELHSPARWYDEFCDDPSCEQEHVEINVADLYHARPSWLACECCSGGDLSETHEPAPWPCPTIRAIDGEAIA